MSGAEPGSATTLVSCVCAVGRAELLPWLWWGFERQTWANKELIVVLSEAEPTPSLPSASIKLVHVPAQSSLAQRRAAGLAAAAGSVSAWFDAADWQHPERLARLVPCVLEGAWVAGSCLTWHVDPAAGRAAPVALVTGMVAGSAVFATQTARRGECPDGDVVELGENARSVREPLTFRVSVRGAPPYDGELELALSQVRGALGSSWADTDERLQQLRRSPRVAPSTNLVRRVPWTIRGARSARARGANVGASNIVTAAPSVPSHAAALPTEPAAALPSVSVMIKATVLDAPYLEGIVPHMIAQAGFAFAERLIVVDPRLEFSGKYSSRPAATRAALDGALERLLARGAIDRVVHVPYEPEIVADVQTTYFGRSGLPTHASTGGPIYPTLFGIESCTCDHVLQMDADMFFYSQGASWVAESLRAMQRNPRVWFAMTHAGPPAGEPGTVASLGAANTPRASWSAALEAWCFRGVSTRYFLTDRRLLRGRVPAAWQGGALKPLERCLAQALVEQDAMRINLAKNGSWDLHGHYHGDPFPDWVPRVIDAVQAGDVPALQRGNYNLRLDEPTQREAWRELLERRRQLFVSGSSTVREPTPAPTRTSEQRSASMGTPATPSLPASTSEVPVAVVIPIRDRAGARVRNVLASLGWQSARAREVIVVSHGSQPHIDAELAELCGAFGARLIRCGDPSEPWRKPVALNTGIRGALTEPTWLATLDADMILAPNFLRSVVDLLESEPQSFVMCQSSDLPSRITLPASHEELLWQLPLLKHCAAVRGQHGTGGIQAAARDFFMRVRGYDERFEWWGAEDGDMAARARASGLGCRWLTEQTFMLHQWHPKRHAVLEGDERRERAAQAWQENHRLAREDASIVRNAGGWGGRP